MTAADKLQSNHKQLSRDEVELFMKEGCLVVPDVFSKETASKIIPLVCAELRLDMNDQSTWPRHLVALQKILQKKKTSTLPQDLLKFTPVVVLRKELETELLDEIYTERYNGIINELCGHGRWQMRKGIGHWPILFPLFQGQPWQPLEGGWHLDGDFQYLSLTSGDWGLILMHLFTDIQQGGGGTAVRLGSHHYTARILAEAGPDGLEREEIIPRVLAATKHLPVREITGNNGDLIIMHPWIIHTSSLNTGDQLRIAANKHISLYTPMNFKRNKRSDFSPVELTVVDSIAGQDFNQSLEDNKLNETSEKRPEQKWHSLSSMEIKTNGFRSIKAKDWLRILILRTNPYWPFSILNKQPYYVALKVFTKLCRKYPEIKSVYLRHPLTKGSWTPALSDLDLTVITGKDIADRQEFDFLNSFWKKFRRFKKLFPMCGEIYMLNEADFELWQKLEFEGSNIHNWSLLSGSDSIKNYKANSNSQFNSAGFDHAFSFYLNYFSKLFNHKSISPRLALLDLLRVKKKIFRCLQLSGNNYKISNSVIPPKTEMFRDVVHGLKDSLVKDYIPSSEIESQWRKEAEEKNNLLVDNEAVDISELSPWHDYIQSIYLNYNKKMFIILKDGLDRKTFNNSLGDIGRAFSDEQQLPVILNVNLFRYFVRQYKPFEYGHFMSYRTLAFGTDILPDIAPPAKSALANKLIREAAEILKFPSCQKFFSSSGKWYSDTEFKHISDTALLIKYCLEQDSIRPWYPELLKSCNEAYPEYAEKIEELRTRSKKLQGKSLRFEWFKLIKQLANDVQKSILASDKHSRDISNDIQSL